jgi:NADH dehydrogenase [ubiquinone] 1 alpha subcomplex assembly factor 2
VLQSRPILPASIANPASAQWVQWLRHTRFEPPSINEQQLDEIRQAQMKDLAARADARWAAKPSALDKRAVHQQLPFTHPPQESTPPDFAHQAQVQETVGEAARELAQETPMERQELSSSAGTIQDTLSSRPPEARSTKVKEFKGYKLGKEGEQQPESWAPKAARRR